jgi:pyruvate/2-oxoglutarate/acetoin dehydrogenase E1 component
MAVRGMSLVEAANQAFAEEMRRDESVILLGEDVRIGLYGFTAGLVEEFGEERILDMPLSEAGFAGLAIGAALAGLRPIVDFMISTFMYLSLDQIINNATKMRYMYGGQVSVPIVFWALTGARGSTGAQHADAPYGLLMGVPGLRIAVPASPADTKGILKAAVRCDDPVLVLQPTGLGRMRAEAPPDDYVAEIGKPAVLRSGTDVTAVTFGAMVPKTLEAATRLAAEGVQVEVIDLRWLAPLGVDEIATSVEKTKRLVVVDEAHREGGASAEVLARICEHMDGQPFRAKRVTAPDAPIPFSPALESEVIPSTDQVVTACRSLMTDLVLR